MKRSLVTLALAALLALPVVARADSNDEIFRQKNQGALFPSLRAIPSAVKEIPSKVKRMVTPKANTGPQADTRSTTTKQKQSDQPGRDFLF